MQEFKTFPKKSLLKDWATLVKMDRDDVVHLHNEWQDIHSYNLEVSERNKLQASKEIDDIIKKLTSSGIKVYKYSKSKYSTEKLGYLAWVENNIIRPIQVKYPTYHSFPCIVHYGEQQVDGITLINNQSPTRLLELYDKIAHQYKIGVLKEKEHRNVRNEALLYATTNKLDIVDATDGEIIAKVDQHARQRFINEEIKTGKVVQSQAVCHTCKEFTLGQDRCKCGKRRIILSADGRFDQGYTLMYFTVEVSEKEISEEKPNQN